MMFRPLLWSSVAVLFLLSSCGSDTPKEPVEDLGNVPFTKQIEHDTSLVLVLRGETAKALEKLMLEEEDDFGFEQVALYKGTEDNDLSILVSQLSDASQAVAKVEELGHELSSEQQLDRNENLMVLHQELSFTKDAPDSLVVYMSFNTMEYGRWEEAFLNDFREDPEKDFQVLAVYRGVDEPNQVHMIFRVNDPQYVEKMEKNTAFRMKMLASGVVSYPVTYKLRSKEV